MSFFGRERTSLREDSSIKHAFDYNKHYTDMLNGLNGEFTFGRNSGFPRSPLEIFRMNVEKYCGGFTPAYAEEMDEEEEIGNAGTDRDWGQALEYPSGYVQEYTDEDNKSQFPERDACDSASDVIRQHRQAHTTIIDTNEHCCCSGEVISQHCRARPTRSDTNIISVMSVSFEPFEALEPEKPSLLKKLTTLMNSNFNSRKEKMMVPQSVPLKQRVEPRQWSACECQVHIGKHSSCCHCQEPYHRMNCECEQHNGSHSYCCRCDPRLLQEYDQHLKKKRYLRLLSDDEELSPVNSLDHRDDGIPGFRREPPRPNAASFEGFGRKPFMTDNKKLPEPNCLHLQLYRDSKDRYKQGQTKASLSLQHFLGVESGFTLDKESNTIAILCQDVTVVLAFDTRERLIQWQVKIASNLGEDQQYLIQIGSAPPKAKIAPGPARLHIQEYRFSLTMGVPPRLIGVWTISQLRRYGVVDNRFIFEGGSTCGRLEGVYVLVTDQGEEITKAFKAASEGKLIPKRKQVSRNSSVSVTESPRRRANSRVKSVTGSEQCDQPLPMPMWENMEVQDNSECGDTVSVLDLNMDSMPNEGWSGENAPCQSCKVGNMPRSLTVFNTPGTGFNPAWIMEAINCDHETNRSTICCNASVISESRSSDDSGCRSRAVSPCGVPTTTCLVHDNRSSKCLSHSSCESTSYENYDTPRNICASVVDSNRVSMTSSLVSSMEEYYDTPKKLKENLHAHPHHVQQPLQPIQLCSCQPMTICRHICAPASLPSTCTRCHPPRHRCTCQVMQICSCQNMVTCAPKPTPVVCSCPKEAPPPCQVPPRENPNHQPVAAAALYAKVDLLKKTKRKETNEPAQTVNKAVNEVLKECVPNYENMGFAQSLEYYENLKDLRVRVDKCCVKCQSQHQGTVKEGEKPKVEEEYLVMGPVCERTDSNVPPYLHMKPVDKCSCPTEQFKEPVSTQAQSATPSPCLRRHDPASCYATNERRRIAQIRRRSNSMDSGRYLDGVDINAKTSSSTHNTLTPNSQNNSVDSIPSQAATPKRVAPAVKPEINLADFRRPSSVPCKANRDSSASNDSGVSTGSLKNFGGGFLEFETIITPLSKVRQRSLDAMPLVLPRRSKSSDPLDELSFKFTKAEIKSSSAEAEVPICPPKKDCSKDISVSSSSGALTIPYIDSISSSSGASDMSDYIETLSMSSYSSSEHDNLRHCHSAVTFLRPRSGKEYQKIDRSNLEYAKAAALQGAQHTDSPSPGYVSSTSSN